MNSMYKNLKLLNEALLLEYDRKDLKTWAGDDLAQRYLAIRPKLQAPENDLGYWLKKGDLEEFKKFVSDWESGALKSKSQQKKDEKIAGAELIYSDNNWKVYHITTYEAAKQLGSGTTWCITGRYRGYESKGKYYFNSYIEQYDLDGYYFLFDLNHRDKTTGDYLKYCIGVSKSNKIEFIYNGMQDRNITAIGIPNIPTEAQIQPINGVTINYDIPYHVSESGVLDSISNFLLDFDFRSDTSIKSIKARLFEDNKSASIVKLPEGLESIGLGAFMNSVLATIDLPSTLKDIGAGAFFGTQLTDITIPEGVTKINTKVFAHCDSLKNVYLPSTITYIAADSFVCQSPEVRLIGGNKYVKEYCEKYSNIFDNLKYIGNV